jgi:DNA segregation ATPase FtsK/SpoIIIE-like protein
MKTTGRIAGAVIILFLMCIADLPNLSEKLVPDAQAFRGRGAAFVVGAAVGSAGSSAAAASASASQQQAAAAQYQAAAAQQDAAAAQQQAAIEREKTAAAQQQAAAAQQQAAAAQQQAALAQQQAALAQQPAVASGRALPLGTVVSALPGGCVSTPSGGVNYYYCGGNFYQASYQGSSLVYVTTKPK